MPRSPRGPLAALGALVALATLSSCSALGPALGEEPGPPSGGWNTATASRSPEAVPGAALTYHAAPDATGFLIADYAAGARRWNGEGTLCGISEGVAVMERNDATVVATDLRTGSELWRGEGITCVPSRPKMAGSVGGGLVFSKVTTATGHGIRATHVTSRQAITIDTGDFGFRVDRVLGSVGDAFLLQGMSGTQAYLIALASNQVVWKQAGDFQAQECVLVDKVVACRTLYERYAIWDAATGKAIVPDTRLEPLSDVLWASDGFIVTDPSPLTRSGRAYDYSGTSHGRVAEVHQPTAPSSDDVRYPLADLSRPSRVEAVAQDGTPAVVAPSVAELRVVATGAELPEGTVRGVNAAGTVFFVTGTDGSALMRADGSTVATLEEDSLNARTIGGYAVGFHDGGVSILIPG